MTRKLLSLVVAVAVILSSVSVAFAATVPSDVTSDYVKSVSKLQSLNIMQGYPDGTFKPDQTITRAEFAKIAVVALGMTDAATISAGTTNFSDVAADHWAAGYINVASSQGIINGYPDGTYKPEQTINYAESITILTKMLGYGPVLAGKAWPSAYVAKANQVGITSGVVLAPTVGASRGNVSRLMSNTLDSKIVEVDSYDDAGKPTYKVSTTKTLMSEKLSVSAVASGDYKTYQVTGTPSVQSGAVVAASTLTNVDDGTVTTKKFAAGLNADDYLGLNIKAWTNSDGEICIAEIQNAAADIYEGLIVKDSAKLSLVGKSTSYESVATGFTGYLNSTGPAASLTMANIITKLGDADKATGRVVLSDGKIKFINAIVCKSSAQTNLTDTLFTVKDIKDGYIRSIGGVTSDIKISTIKDNITTKSTRYDFIKNGVAKTVDDVAAGDVVLRIQDGSYERWIITATEVTGTLTGISGTGTTRSLTIGGTAYSVGTKSQTTYDNGSNYTADATTTSSDSFNKEVTVRLNAAGQIAYFLTTASSATYYYGIFSTATKSAVTNGVLTDYVTLYKPDGTKVTYALESTADLAAAPTQPSYPGILAQATINGVALTGGNMFEYQLTADGKIKLDTVKAITANSNSYTVTTDQTTPDDNKINSNLVASDTVIFNVYDVMYTGDPVRLLKYATIDAKAHDYTYVVDGTICKYVIVNGADNDGNQWSPTDDLSSSTSGVITGYGTNADGEYVTLNENGTEKNYVLSGVTIAAFMKNADLLGDGVPQTSAAEKGYYVEYAVNSAGKITSVTAGVYANGSNMTAFSRSRYFTYRVVSVDTTNRVIKVTTLDSNNMAGNHTLYFRYSSTDLNIYDCLTKTAPVGGKAITDIAADDYIWVNVGPGDRQTVDITRIVKVNRDDVAVRDGDDAF